MKQDITIPIDDLGSELDSFTLTGVAKSRTIKALGSSYLVTLQDDTKYLRVYAISKDVFMKWASDGEDYCKATNFDEVIPAGQYIDFAVPNKTDGTKYSLVQFVGREADSTVIVIEK